MKKYTPHLKVWSAEEKEKSRQAFLEGSKQRAEAIKKQQENRKVFDKSSKVS